MCELLAISSRLETNISLSLDQFASRGNDDSPNNDGWGIVFYSEGDVRRFRDTGPAADSALVKFVEQQTLCSTRFLAHIRDANVGAIGLPNTHPFSRELGGTAHTFAHNGFLEKIRENPSFDLHRFRTIGDTDSEWAFCSLLDRLSDIWLDGSGVPDISKRVDIVTEFAGQIRQLGLSNFLYCDGDAIFVHADRRRQPDGQFRAPGLWLRQQMCVGDGEQVCGGGLMINSPMQQVAMAASVPLTDSGWEPLDAGTILVFKDGEVIATR